MRSVIRASPPPPLPAEKRPEVDVPALEADLRRGIEGEVRFAAGDRALYATDGSNYRHVPIGIVIPRTIGDVIEAVAIARRHGAPVLARGGGTSLAGQCCNIAVVLDFSKYLRRVLEIDAGRRRARVQPGCILDTLRGAAQAQGLTFGPDPATHEYCTIGGMLGNNACGVHSILSEFYGPGPRAEDNVEELDVLTVDGLRMRVGPTSEEQLEAIIREGGRRGQIYGQLRDLRDRYATLIRARFPNIPRRVSGYNLPDLLPERGFNVARALVGSESTCVTILEATVTLLPHPACRALLVLGYPNVFEAGDHVARIREHRPIGIEGVDAELVGSIEKKGLKPEYLGLLPEGQGWLLVEFGGETQEEADTRARETLEALGRDRDAPSMRLYSGADEQTRVWEIRESGLGATAFVPGESDTWEGWEDSAVPPDRVGEYLRDLRTLLDRHGYGTALYGHFGHGCIHCRINFDLTSAAGIERFRRFTRESAHLVVDKYGGSLSGEHGDGQARGDLLSIMFGHELMQAFRDFKAIWDPDGLMNPGKIIDAQPRDESLRLGVHYSPASPPTHFQFPEDGGSFAHAALRCVGVGKCRRLESGTMCPSYMVLKEEKHTTRGRAHLLFEMLQGDVITGGWKSEAVKESLDLCLSCKGCKGDCPVNVDLATYKAEFLSHYYDDRLRPREAYAFGLIPWWAELASLMPSAANLVAQTPGLRAAARALAGMAPERRIPLFARRTFRSWVGRRGSRNGRRAQVLLWPDTFNNHFSPWTLAAGTEVLEHAGYDVSIPEPWLCCGRPLYDFGMLDLAKRQLRHIIAALQPQIAAGTPIVGLEPSCVAVFRDELTNLFPHDEHAGRLRDQTMTLGEFLQERAGSIDLPQLPRQALVHGHCHQEAIMQLGDEQAALSRLGLNHRTLDSGCCGMAGAFGYERGKYAIGMAAGERVLLPSVREAPVDTVIVADGFSCRKQIAHATDREALHLAEVIQLALRYGDRLPAGEPPERVHARMRPSGIHGPAPAAPSAAALIATVLLAGTALLARRR